MAAAADDWTATLHDARPRTPSHRSLWAGAVATYGIGDATLTAVGLAIGAVEMNPALTGFVGSHGFTGIIAVKLAALIVFAGVYRAIGRPANVGVPAGLLALGTAATVWNVAVCLGVVA